MDPVNNTTPQPTQNPQQQVPPQAPNAAPAADFSMDSITKDAKMIGTIKTFVIYGIILAVVNVVVGFVTASIEGHFAYSYSGFGVAPLIFGVITGAIGGAIGGVLFHYLFAPVRDFIKGNAFLSKYIHSIFTLFWMPSLVGSVIGGVLGLLGLLSLGALAVGVAGAYGAASVLTMFISVVITFAAHVAISYFYAKAISAKLSATYTW
jgi:hypothetical protein